MACKKYSAYGCLVAGQSPWAPALSVTQKRHCSYSYGSLRYISVIYVVASIVVPNGLKQHNSECSG